MGLRLVTDKTKPVSKKRKIVPEDSTDKSVS